MNDSELDCLIAGLRNERLPECPSGLAGIVLSRVRQARVPFTGDSPWAGALGIALRPQVATALFVLTIALSALTTAVAATRGTPERTAQSDPLGFQIICDPQILECYHMQRTGTHRR